MTIPLLLTPAHQAVALQCREEGPVPPVNQLPILCRGILAIDIGGIHPIVNRVEVRLFACAVHEADDSDPSYDPMLSTAVLRPHQLDEPRVALIMYAVIHNQKGVWAIVNQ